MSSFTCKISQFYSQIWHFTNRLAKIWPNNSQISPTFHTISQGNSQGNSQGQNPEMALNSTWPSHEMALNSTRFFPVFFSPRPPSWPGRLPLLMDPAELARERLKIVAHVKSHIVSIWRVVPGMFIANR